MFKSDLLDIDDFVLKEDIGEGNFGKVKKCIYKQTGEEYAIKIINKKKIKDKMKNSFFKENDIATKFNHINVIYVFQIFEDKENFYLVMEYCQKGELFDYIVEKQRLSENEAAIFFYQLINGVEYIHSQGIAHRDLKPENLLLTNDKTLKIIDFGLSHEFDPYTTLLKTKCGSPSYAAPEIISCPYYDGFKTDIWCCGIILYAMLCGFLPFEGDDNTVLFRNILECDPEMPDWLSISSRDLIIRILNPDPDDRITLEEIKRHKFYLKGKKLCKVNYDDINVYIKSRKLNINREKKIDDIFKLNINDINNNEKESSEKKEKKNIKFNYCNTINGNNISKTKPFIKNINMKNNNSINSFKKKLKNLKLKEKNFIQNNDNNPLIKNKLTQITPIESDSSSNIKNNINQEKTIAENNVINKSKNKFNIKNKISSLLSRLSSNKKPLFLKVINSAFDNNINSEEENMDKNFNMTENNEQKKCNIILTQLKNNFRKLNHQKKLLIKDNYIHTSIPSSNRLISYISNDKKQKKEKNNNITISFRDKAQLNKKLFNNNERIVHTKYNSLFNKRRIKTESNRNYNKNKKISLINNLYSTKPIVYCDNLSININNINVHQKTYNNTLNVKNNEKHFSNKDNLKNKRNNTISSNKPKYHLNLNEYDLIAKSSIKDRKNRRKNNKDFLINKNTK